MTRAQVYDPNMRDVTQLKEGREARAARPGLSRKKESVALASDPSRFGGCDTSRARSRTPVDKSIGVFGPAHLTQTGDSSGGRSFKAGSIVVVHSEAVPEGAAAG